jgi:small-conductance mechanosensitive channel
MNSVISDFLEIARRPETLIELALIILLIGLAGIVGRLVRKQAQDHTGISGGGIRRLAFPLAGILFLSLMRFFAHHFGFPLHFIAIAVQLFVALAMVRVAVYAMRRAFPNSISAPSIERVLVTLIWLGFALDIVGLMPDLIEWLDSFSMHVGKSQLTLWEVLRAIVSVIATLLVALWMGGIIESRLMEASAFDMSVKVVLTRISRSVLVLLAVLVGMSMVGMDITTLSVFGGALGVGLGFGMQKIASNYVSGFIILFDKSIRIGNTIQVGQDRGEVKQITTRYTVLRSGSGMYILVPNETLIGSTVQNETYADPRQKVTLRVQISYRSNVEQALQILTELAQNEPRVLEDPAPASFLVSLEDNGLVLELGFWIGDPENGSLGIRSNINRAILQRFAAANIEIPYPQREIRVLSDGSPAAQGLTPENAARLASD